MQLLKVGAAVLNQTPLAWEGNLARIAASIDAARRAEVSLLCLPELCITGYGCEDAFLSPSVRRIAWEMLQRVAPLSRGMILSVGLPVLHTNALYNTAAMLVEGTLGLSELWLEDGIIYWREGRPAELRIDSAVRTIKEIEPRAVPVRRVPHDVRRSRVRAPDRGRPLMHRAADGRYSRYRGPSATSRRAVPGRS